MPVQQGLERLLPSAVSAVEPNENSPSGYINGHGERRSSGGVHEPRAGRFGYSPALLSRSSRPLARLSPESGGDGPFALAWCWICCEHRSPQSRKPYDWERLSLSFHRLVPQQPPPCWKSPLRLAACWPLCPLFRLSCVKRNPVFAT
jgi:hypothetical protein